MPSFWPEGIGNALLLSKNHFECLSMVVVTTESQYIGSWIGGPPTSEELMTQDDLGWLETKLNDSKWLRMT